jgi:TetR/AcrR family transcriptional regulator, cholesterol catabolism regulator
VSRLAGRAAVVTKGSSGMGADKADVSDAHAVKQAVDTVTVAGRKRRRIPTAVRDRTLVKQRRDQIVNAAIQVFSRRGYDKTSVREVAETAGLSPGSVYSYIRAKEDILYLVFDKLITAKWDEVRRAIDGIDDPVEKASAALRAELEVANRYHDEVVLLYRESHSLDRTSLQELMDRETEYIEFLRSILADGYRRGVFHGDAELSADVAVYLSAILALRWWRLRRFNGPDAIDGLSAFLLRGLGIPEKGSP